MYFHGVAFLHGLSLLQEVVVVVVVVVVVAVVVVDRFCIALFSACLLYTSPSPRDVHKSRMPSSA